MLEKIAGVALVNKLRAILLLEADFNFCNKLIFGKRMLDLARANGMVPEEIYSGKGRTGSPKGGTEPGSRPVIASSSCG